MARNPRRGPTPAASIDDWLNLVDPDGAFLTPSQLRGVFPHGFDPMSAEQRAELRSQLADLINDSAASRAGLRGWLLSTVLEWGDQLADGQQLPATSLVRAAEHGVQLRPTQALLDVDDSNLIRLAVFVWPLGTRLDRRPDVTVAGDTWPASPVQRAEMWCRESGIPLALVTDDDQWVLVWAPRSAPAASCRWRIGDLADERILQAGFRSLLGARRFFAAQTDETLEALFRRAADAEAEITKGLGLSVRRSVELLVAAISRDDVANNGSVLNGVAATEVYEASVTVLMRLVFLLFAEERRLLPAEDPLWAESYSVLTLRDDLRSSAVRDGDDALERRSTAWHRLLATFRAVHGGVNHDRLTLPAYGGSLFDPDRFPFLEGRRERDHLIVNGRDFGPAHDAIQGPGRPIAIDDRTVLAILDALLTIEVKAGRAKVAQRVSYKALDVEQIGHCYEGLLDHGASPIEALALGLVGTDGAEPEIAITDLEQYLARGTTSLGQWLADKDRCNKSTAAIATLLTKQPEGVELARLRVACGHDDDVVARVLPFWGLIRTDLRGLPIVLLPGSQWVTQTSTRRNMGAQYTTKALAEEVVRYALEPLVYEPGPQNEADSEKWELRTPAQILDLRVCDPAVGSGAILTAAGRYLADRLIESVAKHGPGEGPFAERLGDLAAAPADDQTVLARREIVDHCLYGVDKNPVAAEMAKLSLWLTTMARERPFTFLDHAIQVGDSLLGITDLEQLRWLHLDPSKRKGARGFETVALDDRIEEATDLARLLQERSVVTLRDAAEKQGMHVELRDKLADLAVVADAIVGAAFSTVGNRGATPEERLGSQIPRVRTAIDITSGELERSAALATVRSISADWLRTNLPDEVPVPWERQCLHWPLAFPEVFFRTESGFDAVVGNPPYLGGKRISTSLGTSYEAFVKIGLAEKGAADLCSHFVRRVFDLMSIRGCFGLLTTDRISHDDSRRLSLDLAGSRGISLYRAVRQAPWPGEAATMIAKLFGSRKTWAGPRILDGKSVDRIPPSLSSDDGQAASPQVLVRTPLASLGTGVYGEGFVVARDWRPPNIQIHEQEKIRPYLIAADLTGSLGRVASRDIIDMNGVESEADLKHFPALEKHLRATVEPIRSRLTGQIHEARFWRFWDQRPELEAWLRSHDRALVVPRLSKFFPFAWVSAGQVIGDRIIVVASEDDYIFGVLQSSFHGVWVDQFMSLRGTRAAYEITACLRTFPFPREEPDLKSAAIAFAKFRDDVMSENSMSLTSFYNEFHDSSCRRRAIESARELQASMDRAVASAYGLGGAIQIDFEETRQGVRFTLARNSRLRVLDFLTELNRERYGEEAIAGLHQRTSRKSPAKRATTSAESQASLL